MDNSAARALKFFKQNEIQNSYLIYRLQNGCIGAFFFVPDGVCLWESEDNKYFYAVTSKNAMEPLFDMVQLFRKEHNLTDDIAQVSMISNAELAQDFFDSHPEFTVRPCVQYLATAPNPEPAPNPEVEILPLTPEFFPWVLRVYEHPELSEEYLLRRIKDAPALLAMHNGHPVGFFLTHSVSELGPVFIDPLYRGLNIAQLLYSRMLFELGPSNRAVLFVFTSNIASQTYIERMGCPKTDENIVWFWNDN